MAKPLDPKFRHYMLQEIFEQPTTLRSAINHYFAPEFRNQTAREFYLSEREIAEVRRIRIVASGSSRFAGMYGEFVLERIAGVPVEVDYSSQYCYRDPVTEPGELTVLLTQSGTTADTIAAEKEARAKGAKTVVICNVKDSPITKSANGVIYTHAGEEVAVAATKSFTGQLVALFALSLYFGELRKSLPADTLAKLRAELEQLPQKVELALKNAAECERLAEHFKKAVACIVLGRDISFPIALEASLKLKETSYIFAEAFPTGEVKHGPTALVDEKLPVIMILSRDYNDPSSELRYEKSLVNLEEIRQRGTSIVAVVTEGDTAAKQHAFALLRVPNASSLISPILEIIPLQLLAYYLAVARGLNVDSPRHLSKSVIVE